MSRDFGFCGVRRVCSSSASSCASAARCPRVRPFDSGDRVSLSRRRFDDRGLPSIFQSGIIAPWLESSNTPQPANEIGHCPRLIQPQSFKCSKVGHFGTRRGASARNRLGRRGCSLPDSREPNATTHLQSTHPPPIEYFKLTLHSPCTHPAFFIRNKSRGDRSGCPGQTDRRKVHF